MKEKITKIYNAVSTSAVLLGEKNPSAVIPGVDYPLGLGLTADAHVLSEKADDIRKGIFKVITMGEFKTGKSTLINSLIGKEILIKRAVAATAVITIVEYGENKDTVAVYYKGSKDPLTIPITDFNEKFRLRPEDNDEIEEKGYISRFKDVEYAVVERDFELCKNGVRIIDSPGLGDAETQNKVTMGFIPQANAIIFCIDATRAFNKNEKEYIGKNFVGKHPNNVFFIINKMNLLVGNGREEVAESVNYHIKPVFTKDEDFDEDLFKKRVFYMDAHSAEQIRANTGKTCSTQNIEKTGVPEFERSLSEFLTSDAKTKAMFSGNLTTMANSYFRAEQMAKETLANYEKPLSELQENQIKSQAVIKDMRNDIEKIRTTFDMAKIKVYQKTIENLNETIANIEAGWESNAESMDQKIGMIDLAKMMWGSIIQDPDKQKEVLDKITPEVDAYVRRHFDNFKGQNAKDVGPIIDQCVKDVNCSADNFDKNMNLARELFDGVDSTEYSETGNRAQLIVGAMFGDPETMAKGAMGSGTSWSDVIKKTVIFTFTEFILASIFTGGLYLIIRAALAYLQMKGAAGKYQDQILEAMKTNVVSTLRTNISERKSEVEIQLDKLFSVKADAVCKELELSVQDEEQRQRDIIEKIMSENLNIEYEKKRFDEILRKLYEMIGVVYFEVNNEKLTDEKLKKIATV